MYFKKDVCNVFIIAQKHKQDFYLTNAPREKHLIKQSFISQQLPAVSLQSNVSSAVYQMCCGESVESVNVYFYEHEAVI